MADQKVNLSLSGLPTPPALANLQIGKPARKLHVHQMLRAQDRPLANNRRIVASYTWGGEYDHEFGNIDMDDGDAAGIGIGPQLGPYPSATTSRTLMVLDGVPITPGCVLAIHCTYLRSGPTFTKDSVAEAGAQTYTSTGAQGQLSVSCVWDDQTLTETVATVIDLDGVDDDPLYLSDYEGAAWFETRERAGSNYPPGILYDVAEAVQWSQPGITCDITIAALGCARIVDAVIYEIPGYYAITDGDAPGPAHIYAEGAGVPKAAYPKEYPIEGATTGDERFGAVYALDVASEQESQLGPSIWCYTSRRERHLTRLWDTDVDPAPTTIAGVTETVLEASTVATTSPRIDLGPLAYGRQFSTSDPVAIMRENGCAPVAFAAYWAVSSGTGYLRLQADDYSEIELSTTSASYAWTKGISYLACGAHPLDGYTGIITGEAAAGTSSIRYAWAAYWPS